jgi:hypothetical protein
MPEQNDILKELESMGSPLAQLSRQMPYALPSGYFDQLPDVILAQALEKDVISELPKITPYKAPEGYFDKLPQQVMNAIQADEIPAKTKTIPLGKSPWYQVRLAAAAVLLLLIGAGVFGVFRQDSSFDTKLAQLSEESVSEYIQQNIDEFDGQMIESNFGVRAAAATSPSQLTEEEITEYLDETGWQ